MGAIDIIIDVIIDVITALRNLSWNGTVKKPI